MMNKNYKLSELQRCIVKCDTLGYAIVPLRNFVLCVKNFNKILCFKYSGVPHYSKTRPIVRITKTIINDVYKLDTCG